MNAISAEVIADLSTVWSRVQESDTRALVIASANPFLFSAGADVKTLASIDPAAGGSILSAAGALFGELNGARS